MHRRIASAKAAFATLAQSVGRDLLHDTIAQKEALTLDHLARVIETECVVSKRRCPACTQTGNLLGELETAPQVNSDWNTDSIIYSGDYDYYLIPDSFYCNVCRLTLGDPEELGIVKLPNEKFRLRDDEVTDALIEYASDREQD